METTCTARRPTPIAPIVPGVPWIAAVLAVLALAGALATAFVATDARDLAPRHTAATLRATAL
jgi:hypothetical protein